MDLVNLGHLGFAIDHAGERVLVDPWLAAAGECAPAEQAYPDEAALASAPIVLTSGSPLHADLRTLERLAPGRTVLAPRPVSLQLPARLSEGVTALDPWETRAHGALEITAIPPDWGFAWSVVVAAGDAAVWFLGESAVAVETAARVRSLVADRGARTVVASTWSDHLIRVLRGEQRGFPYRSYELGLTVVCNAANAGWDRILLAGGVAFRDRAAWMGAFATPVPASVMCSDVRHVLPRAAVERAEVGAWIAAETLHVREDRPRLRIERYLVSAFDPSVGFPDLAPAGDPVPELEARLARSLAWLRERSFWPTLHLLASTWELSLEIRERSVRGDRTFTMRLGADAPVVTTERDGRANVRVAATAHGLDRLLRGEARVAELALQGHLRTSEKIYRVQAGTVRRPGWLGYPITDDRADVLTPLLPPWELVELLACTRTQSIVWDAGGWEE